MLVHDFVTINGGRTANTVSGAGPTVVLLHRWAYNHLFWREQTPSLVWPHRVPALDLRGHGDSDVPDQGYSIRIPTLVIAAGPDSSTPTPKSQ